jgi:hypothetical protein
LETAAGSPQPAAGGTVAIPVFSGWGATMPNCHFKPQLKVAFENFWIRHLFLKNH